MTFSKTNDIYLNPNLSRLLPVNSSGSKKVKDFSFANLPLKHSFPLESNVFDKLSANKIEKNNSIEPQLFPPTKEVMWYGLG
jgi:hypothetical protein